MVLIFLQQFLAAFLGTIAFSVLFKVPGRYYLFCGQIGAMGWSIYWSAVNMFHVSPYIGTFAAAGFVVMSSRIFCIKLKCPVTVFLLSGIFPLVPGVGIYWFIYYFILGDMDKFTKYGRHTVGIAVAIVLGIIFVFEIPANAIEKICHLKHSKDL